jgi:hypothetical protein
VLKWLKANGWKCGYLLVVAILIALAFFVPRETQPRINLDVPNAADTALKLLDKIATMAASLSTAFVAATLGLVIRGDDEASRSTAAMGAAIVIFLAAAVSYFGIYLGYVRMLSTVSVAAASSINPIEVQMIWAVRLQFWGVVIEAIALGFLVVAVLETRLSRR